MRAPAKASAKVESGANKNMLAHSAKLQHKLTIGSSNDPLEAEADRVADQVLAFPASSAIDTSPPRIQRFAGPATGDPVAAPASVDRVLAGSGRPLEPSLRSDMEQRFDHDFSKVRVHSGEAAALSAREMNSKAFAVGQNIVFGAERFSPRTHEGLRLIAHELAHVVQQAGAVVRPQVQRKSEKLSVFSEIQGLSMKILLPKLDALSNAILTDEEAARSVGGPRLVVAMRATRAKRQGSTVEFLRAEEHDLKTLPPDQYSEIFSWLNQSEDQQRQDPTDGDCKGSANAPTAPKSAIDPRNLSDFPRSRDPSKREPMHELLPPPRTSFESDAFRWNLRRIHDSRGEIIGFFVEELGVFKVYDIFGQSTVVGERPLEKPLIDPIDLVPFELIGSIAAKASVFAAKAVAKAAARVTTKEIVVEGGELAAKSVADEAAQATSRAVRGAGSEAIDLTKSTPDALSGKAQLAHVDPAPPEITPPSHQLAPAKSPRPVPATAAKNVGSYGESVVEAKVLAEFLPKAHQMSAKAAGFDAFEGATTKLVTTIEADGSTLLEEEIAGGTWYSIKGISKPTADLVKSNIDDAMSKAVNGLRMVRKNQFERVAPGFKYRTKYVAPPDKVIVVLQLQEGAVTKDIFDVAKKTIADSVHRSDLPPVDFVIRGY